MFERGIYCVVTPDRFDDLRRFIKSMRRFCDYNVQVMLAKDFPDVHRLKTLAGVLSSFKTTILMDTDVNVNGCLAHIFRSAEGGRVVCHYEEKSSCYNTGVVAFPSELGRPFSAEWNRRFEEGLAQVGPDVMTRQFQFYDQYHFNQLVREKRWRGLMYKLEDPWNYILKHHTPAEESQRFGDIKVFHFLHDGVAKLEDYRSWREWMEL